jgi:sRNA-binding regulator protein Hfq
MKAPLKRAVVFFWLSLAALLPPAWCSNDQKDGWDSLKRVPHDATLTFADRGGNCMAGRIKSYDSNAIVVTRHNESDVKIDRPNVLRVTTNPWPSGLVYSGRSSWFDVEALVPARRSKKWRATVLVEMSTGENARGQLIETSQGEITLRTSGKSVVIPKRQISTLSYIRPKPLSDSAEYANDELAWMKIFDPQLWPTLFHAQGSLVVRIYDVNLPQDDSPIVCKAGPPWHTLTQPVP